MKEKRGVKSGYHVISSLPRDGNGSSGWKIKGSLDNFETLDVDRATDKGFQCLT